MAFEDVGVQILFFAAAHGLDEVGVVVGAAAEFLDDFSLGRVGDGRIVAGADHIAFAAIENVAYAGIEELLARQAADFKNQLAVAVIENADLRVGRLSVVYITKPAAQALYGFGQFVLVESPPRYVHLMDALVAQVAVAVVPGPVPVIVEAL